MQAMRILMLALALVGTAAVRAGGSAKVTPVQKVIQLMEGMLQKGKKEKHDEQTQFAAYKQFCDDTSAAKAAAIEEAALTIQVLQADIAKHTATAAQLASEIAGHDEDIAVWNADIKAANKVRAIEKTDFDKMNLDYSESIDALERAIAVLKKESYDRKQAASLMQIKHLSTLDLIPAKAKRAIDLFFLQGMDASSEQSMVAAPEANAYEFQSGSIVEILEKLLDEFTDKRTDLVKTEMNSKHAFEMLVSDLESQISKAEEDRSTKSENKAMNLKSKAGATADLTETSASKAADEKYKSDLDATCAQKSSDFESRQGLRTEELQAIEKAISIISSSAVTGNAGKYLPSLAQKASALGQLRAVSATETAQTRVAEFLHHQAKQLGSRVLERLAARVSEDPFGKVKKMIKDLIVRLMDEANEEATHKGWCDTELATNKQTRAEKTHSVEKLTAEIEELTASIALLGEDISELTAAVAQLDAAMAEATKIRAAEKEENAQTVADAQEAQAAVSQAMLVLKQFYAKAAEATAFVQQPEIFSGPYKGMQAENGGVIGMLEVIQSDFARLESDTKTSEASAQKEYEEFITDSKVDRSAKSQDLAFKTTKKADEQATLVSRKGDLENTQADLDAALLYFDKLKPSCVDESVSYVDRVARRQAEISSLQEALQILNGEDIA